MERDFDGHHLGIEGDIISVRFAAELGPETARAMLAFLEEQVPKPRRFYMITHAASVSRVGAESRRILGEWEGFRRLAADAIVGAPRLMRVVGLLTIRAIQLYQRYEFPYAFFDREDQARVWLEKIRHKQHLTHRETQSHNQRK